MVRILGIITRERMRSTVERRQTKQKNRVDSILPVALTQHESQNSEPAIIFIPLSRTSPFLIRRGFEGQPFDRRK